MNRPLLALLAASCLVSTAAAQVKPLALRSTAPLRTQVMRGVDGKEYTLESAAGAKGTLVVFTCNACPWVKMWQERLAAIGNAAAKQGVGVIAINSNDPAVNAEDDFAEMARRAKQLGLVFPYVVDATSELARVFGATRTPEAFLFDPKDRLVYHGTVDDNARDAKAVKEPWLRQAVDAVAAGRTVATPETKAMGCTIKFRAKSAS